MTASLVSYVVAGGVYAQPVTNKGRGHSDLQLRALCHGLCARNCGGSEVLLFIQRAPFGVCGLLALPNNQQLFGDSLAGYPRSIACRSGGFLLLRGVSSGLDFGGNAGPDTLRTILKGTQWGQLNRLTATQQLLAAMQPQPEPLLWLLTW